MGEPMTGDELRTAWARGVRPGLLAMLALLDEHMRLHDDKVEALR